MEIASDKCVNEKVDRKTYELPVRYQAVYFYMQLINNSFYKIE